MARELQGYLDPSWQGAFGEAAEQQLGEALCLFYVALTRARQAIYLFPMPRKSVGQTWGSVIHTLFGDEGNTQLPDVSIYQKGDPDWYRNLQQSPSSAEADPRPSPLQYYRIALGAAVGDRESEWIAPSALKDGEEPSLGDLWRGDSHPGAVIGKLVHRWMEEIRDWLESGVPSKKRLLEIANASMTYEELSRISLPEWADRFGRYLEMPQVRSALSLARYDAWHQPRRLRLEVSRERRLLQRLEGNLVRGSIDRCILGYEGDRVSRAEILDFKIDQCPDSSDIEGWVAERIQVHAPQLQLYGSVLRQQYGLQPDQLALTMVLLSVGRVVSIPVQATQRSSDASSRFQVL
jgi:ATP-dependent exoDNAse (exonuclease V) beta subunit